MHYFLQKRDHTRWKMIAEDGAKILGKVLGTYWHRDMFAGAGEDPSACRHCGSSEGMVAMGGVFVCKACRNPWQVDDCHKCGHDQIKHARVNGVLSVVCARCEAPFTGDLGQGARKAEDAFFPLATLIGLAVNDPKALSKFVKDNLGASTVTVVDEKTGQPRQLTLSLTQQGAVMLDEAFTPEQFKARMKESKRRAEEKIAARVAEAAMQAAPPED